MVRFQHLLRVGGVLLFLTGAVALVVSFFLTPKNPIQVYSAASIAVPSVRAPLPTHITISDVIDLPVKEMPFGPQGWKVATDAASIASTSARPGEAGNIVIYSHNLKRLFGHLSQVKIGQKIVLTTEDGIPHTYTVISRTIVNPEEISALRPTQMEVLTLYTCSGLFDTQRLVVQATPSEP